MKFIFSLMILLSVFSAPVFSEERDEVVISVSPINDYQSLIVLSGNYTGEILEELSSLGKVHNVTDSSAYISVNNYELAEKVSSKDETNLIQPNGIFSKTEYRAEYLYVWESEFGDPRCSSKKFYGGWVAAVSYFMGIYGPGTWYVHVRKGGC